ncbi:TonB-dependent receptor [Limnovirga soli]|uniref:TonB-dependent receptor plug domain-containing protein n=1 Tax=Limnovirga soli TaxID=2656915 RepID=A0A8J8FD90_9BACT|nr:TonB-dependent receptor [Limnovirga soli]NNV55873.1 TonB-dependent receptor plug domain-containing protein [Limnovirga soli]
MHLKSLYILLVVLLFTKITIAQGGNLTGKITDENNNQALAGASISIVENGKRTVSEADGTYNIKALATGKYTLLISFVGYNSKKIAEVEIISGQLTELNIVLTAAKSTLKVVVVQSTSAKRESLSALLTTRRNAGVVSDGISADFIRKSPDKNISDVLKRISGTTIQENKFVVVRGMNDRYNEAMLNGALLPSSEPDRKTFAFNIFPSEIVDNITIIKSAAPDLPGSFSGGLVQINTKETPDKNFIALKVGSSYNTITNGKNYAGYAGGKTDWLGIDDGTRDIPDQFPNTDILSNASIEDQAKYGKLLNNNWAIKNSTAPLNANFQITGGFSAKMSKKNTYPKLGGIFGVTYNSTYRFSEFLTNDFLDDNTTSIYNYKDSTYSRSILTSGMGNLILKLNANNKIYWNNLYSISSNDQTVIRSGPNPSSGLFDIKANSFFFTSNRIYNSQLAGEHIFPKTKIKLKWQGYYTDLFRNEPDYRRNTFFQVDEGSPYFAFVQGAPSPTANTGVRYYATVKDETKGANLDLSIPFKLLKQTQTVKTGGAYYYNTRSRIARFFGPYYNPDFQPEFNSGLLMYGQDSIYRPENFDVNNGFLLYEYNDPRNIYNGSITNAAGYLMLDNKFNDKLRLVWGVRYEQYENKLNGITESFAPYAIDLKKNSFLPSANFIYAVQAKSNIRASFSKTVSRPQYRELANQLFYDFLTNITFSGNPGLKTTDIYNYDIRWEQYFKGSQYYSISAFYKKFIDPIESYISIAGADSRTISYRNSGKATNYGIELEGRKNFDFISPSLENLSVYANLSVINSKTNEYLSSKDSSYRPLIGQSPYIMNGSLQYNDPKSNLGISVLYNVIGPRLFLVGGIGNDPIWEKPHAVLDIKLTKSFLKNGIAELTFADILHQNDYQYRDVNNSNYHSYSADADAITRRQNFGMTISLAVGYRF